jgi:hypothetical protein
VIPPEKLRALQDELDARERVRFNNGAVVEVERRLKVTTPLGAVRRFTEAELAAAYALALRGPEPLPQPATEAELAEAYGDDAPW